MDAFDLTEIMEGHHQSGQRYHEFLRANRLSVGMYVLEAGSTDPQQPHTEDEVYYVVEGQGMIQVADQNRPVSAGSVVYVGEQVAHHFHSITQDLKVLVVFVPPRRSRASTT